MQIDILTIFPKMFSPILNESIIKRAQAKGKVKVGIHNIRDFSTDKHRKVDDRPFGGGQGMVFKPEPIFKAVESLRQDKEVPVYLLSPQGRKLDFRLAEDFAKSSFLNRFIE